MDKPLAVCLDKQSLYPDDLDFSSLNEVADWRWFDNAAARDLQDTLPDAKIIVSNKVLVDAQMISRAKQLKLICVAATGINNVDLAAAQESAVTVCNVRAYATASVAQHVFSLILALSRKLFSYSNRVIEGDWSRSEFFCYFDKPIGELEGKTIGIIGYGELGRKVASLAKCFGMNVLIAHSHNAGDEVNRQSGRVDLNTLLSLADVVTLHCPLTASNNQMINQQTLSLMKRDAILINTARGGLVDENALLHALETNLIGAAGLDVLQQEPPSEDNPLINYRSDNLIITPHIAWASRESRQRLIDEIAKNIQAYQHGEPRNVV